LIKRGNEPKDCAFAATRWAEKGDKLALLDFEINTTKRFKFTPIVQTERARNVSYFNCCILRNGVLRVSA